MPKASYRHTAVAPVSPSVVWAQLQLPETWAMVAGVDSTSDHTHHLGNLTGFRFSTSIAGATYRGRARVVDSRVEEAMTVSIRSSELTGSIGVVITPRDDGTGLDVTLEMRPEGLIGALVFPVVTAAVAGSFASSVERLTSEMA